MKHLALLTILFTLFSCQNEDNRYANLIKGDWLGQKTTEGFEHDQTEFLSFEDSTCKVSLKEGALKYKIANDTLYIITPDDRSGKFTIVTLTTDSLVMLSGKHQRDTIKYTRLHAKNNLTPKAIYFASLPPPPSPSGTAEHFSTLYRTPASHCYLALYIPDFQENTLINSSQSIRH